MDIKSNYSSRNILAIIMAGGEGKRLYPLTQDRAKPAVPFGGNYRIIDFTLTNCLNSNIHKIIVLTQYKSLSLNRHLRKGWNIFNSELDEYIISIPPQQRIDSSWYKGTADAIYQNLYAIEKQDPEYILILAGDHIYKMDYLKMLDYHIKKKADLTVGTIEVSKEKSTEFGIIEVDSNNRIIGFAEKPGNPKILSNQSDIVFASMGIYLFNKDILYETLHNDAWRDTAHDFGKNIIPDNYKEVDMYAYNFKDENNNKARYWRDVGTIDAYWEANMDLVAVDPIFNLYDHKWPIRTYQGQYPPAKTVFADKGEGKNIRKGAALDSIICGGCIISGGRVERSVLSPNVRINSYALVYESVLMENVEIGRYANIRRTIIDKGVKIPPRMEIGYNIKEDAKRFSISIGGIVVVP